jgi:hypothetical protein
MMIFFWVNFKPFLNSVVMSSSIVVFAYTNINQNPYAVV